MGLNSGKMVKVRNEHPISVYNQMLISKEYQKVADRKYIII